MASAEDTPPPNELDIARGIRDGTLTSPQQYENVWLFAIRITGTGMAYRSSIDEHVWRDSSLYLNDDFLERCQGLAVIWIHPEKSVLDSKEFADRVIGSVMLPYIKDDEIWGVSKIYDREAAEEMATKPISTSPGVKLDPASRSMIKTPSGEKLLVEGGLSLLDHIAVVTAGVWDKGGPPTGVQNDELSLERADSMDEDMAAADKARKDEQERKDADAGSKLDKVLTHLDAAMSRFDRLDARMDAFEAADKSRKDSDEKEKSEREDRARKDAKTRFDAEREEWMKGDAAECARDDADEESAKKKMVEEGETEEVAADRARKDRKDRMDARRKDAEEKMEKEKDEKADAARADSQASELEMLKRQVAALTAMAKPVDEADRAALADEQARHDSVYIALGGQAPRPMAGESLFGYRARLSRGLQKHSKQWSGIDLVKLDPSTLDIASSQIRNDALFAARSPEDLAEGQLREIVNVDSTGRRITSFVGRGTFIGSMRRPARHVNRINTKAGV